MPAELVRPASLAQAAAAASGDFAFLAGGHTLVPAMKTGLREVERLIDLSLVPGLGDIARDGDRLWVGAMARHAEVAASAEVAAAIPGLAGLARLIGDRQVRARGTLGGSIANNDPAADYPAALLALDAVIETNLGSHLAEGFLQGMFATALGEGEIVTRVGFRIPHASHYAKFRHPASRYALAGVMVARFDEGTRVAVTGMAGSAFRWGEAEQALDQDFSASAVAGLVPVRDDAMSDIHASAEYRAHLAGVMLRRAVAEMAKA